MYINVRILTGFEDILTYSIPDEWAQKDLIGTLVSVPLKNRTESAIIESVFEKLPNTVDFKIKPAFNLEDIPDDKFYYQFIAKLSSYYAIDKYYFLKRVKSFLKEKEIEELAGQEITRQAKEVNLTQEQQVIVNSIGQQLNQNKFYPALIHGVTGSGKTEVYKELIVRSIALQKSVLLLLPEVSLAVQFAKILRKELPASITIFSFHSATSITEKKQLWLSLKEKKTILIIGVHMPIFMPIPNLGLIIIDEEHEVGFQEKKYPRINTKEIALISASLREIPIVLGSATPSISSMHNVSLNKWNFFELKQRFSGAFPKISLVKLTQKDKRKNFWISSQLEKEILKNLENKEQTIVFLNRRGYSFFIICKKCGFVPNCNSCSVSLTLHETGKIKCHYCGYENVKPIKCPSCEAPEKELLKKGIGTQQIVTILQKMFPNAIVARADADATVNKKKWQQTISEFESGKIDILVGTQTITKGYHFPKVTLVGILWADINLSLPFYNADEITLQQLIQVAGRAGRQSASSRVIVQSMIDHNIFKYLSETEYKKYYQDQLNKRELTCYPPIIKLAELELRHSNESVLERESLSVVHLLNYLVSNNQLNVKILGPAQPPVHKIKNIFIKKIFMKSPRVGDLINLYKAIDKKAFSSSILFTPNPLN